MFVNVLLVKFVISLEIVSLRKGMPLQIIFQNSEHEKNCNLSIAGIPTNIKECAVESNQLYS